jgi:type IV pilus assembly protein PilY1
MNMKKTLSKLAARAALALVLLPGASFAATTQIAQVPLLNLDGTGSVKPNLMLLFDNSGSMEYTYTPDHINDNICRGKLTLDQGQIACTPGHPPFMASDFNRQYYNPAIRYQPPVKWDGTSYPEQTSGNTTTWTKVPADGFGVQNKDLNGSNQTLINMSNGFPDIKWCTSSTSSDCRINTASYSYPDNTYTSPVATTATAPYYYNIGVAEYCSDEKLTKCTSVAIGAAAPAGYPVPAKVRWCDSTKLNNCQAKHVGTFIWPKFSTPVGTQISYGTLTIGASTSTLPMVIDKVEVYDPAASGTKVTITNGTSTASSGTDTALKQQTMANAIAASIIAKTGLSTSSYWACTRNPLGGVTDCAVFGITLPADNMLAVIPVSCGSTKSLSNCATINGSVTTNTRAGYIIAANSPKVYPTTSTSFLDVSGGTTQSSSTPKFDVKLGSNTIATGISPGISKTPSQVAAFAVTTIGTGGTVRAYLGGNSAGGTACAAKPNTTICLVNTNTTPANGADTPSGANLSKMNTIIFTGTPAVAQDGVPTTSTVLSNGTFAGSTLVRVNIVTGQSYPKGLNRTDCKGTSVCSYDEEMTNFANWYAYYKTRLQMMKTSVGIAFAAMNENYRVGYARLSAAATGAAMDMKPADFTGTNRSNWYTKLYSTTTSGSTPTRQAMDNVGRMFANLDPYNYASGQEVVQFPCQQNFMILTTDGYWNGGSTANVVNNDNKESSTRFCTKERACVDDRNQTQPSIADVALHWYNGGSSTGTVSLRPSLDDINGKGLVPAAAGENSHLHVKTYTLGLGIDGVMNYDPDYDTNPVAGGDFYNLRAGVTTGCPWNGGGAYVWPDPKVTDTSSFVQERVDDLWHAAINGHGKYFNANEPKDVVEGLSAALNKMQISTGAAAAAATSTPNISVEDNDIFADTFTTVEWYGELSKRKVDINTGEVGTKPVWTTSQVLGKAVGDASDTRTILMSDGNKGLKDFKYSAMTTLEKSWFDSKCSSMAQCTLLTADGRAIVNSGANLVDWLRGQQQYSDNDHFRAYAHDKDSGLPIVLGDIAGSKPAYLRDPRKSYSDSSYVAYKSLYASRPATTLTAANDGMLHAFETDAGNEVWAYAPRITMKKLWQRASTTFGSNHVYTTDGAPELADVQIGGEWRSILVAGMNGGGRGFYALDVTKGRDKPTPLWELCADSTICAKNDPDIGLTFGNPQFGKWQGKWVVLLTSGYNNVPGVDNVSTGSGEGILYVVDVSNGTILAKLSTKSGSTTTPSGLAKITAITDNPATDPVLTYVYGGDVLGQMWRFDLTDPAGTIKIVKMGDAGASQPITTRPDVTLCEVQDTSGGSIGQRVVLYGTGRLLDVPDISNADVQSLYLVKDDGTSVNLRGSNMVEQTLAEKDTGSTSGPDVFMLTSKPVDLRTQNGWYFDWKLNARERNNLDPKIVSGVANVVTNVPSASSSCSVGGTSNFYNVDVCRGSAISSDNIVGGTLSSDSGAVGFIVVRLPKGDLKMITTTAKGQFITSGKPEKDLQGAQPVGWRRVKGE